MAEDMAAPNGNFDPIAQWARLSERVENQGKDIIDLRSNMNTGFQNIQAGLASLTSELRGSTKTQWPVIWSAIGVCFVVITAIGGLAYAPITASMTRIDGKLDTLSQTTVSRQEVDQRAQRAQEDRLRVEAAIADIRAGLVPRAEHERVWQSYDQRFVDQQRQIDEVKQAQTSVYNQRDVIRDILERLDRAEHRTSIPPP